MRLSVIWQMRKSRKSIALLVLQNLSVRRPLLSSTARLPRAFMYKLRKHMLPSIAACIKYVSDSSPTIWLGFLSHSSLLAPIELSPISIILLDPALSKQGLLKMLYFYP